MAGPGSTAEQCGGVLAGVGLRPVGGQGSSAVAAAPETGRAALSEVAAGVAARVLTGTELTVRERSPGEGQERRLMLGPGDRLAVG